VERREEQEKEGKARGIKEMTQEYYTAC